VFQLGQIRIQNYVFGRHEMKQLSISIMLTAFLFVSCASTIAQGNQQPMTNADVVTMVQSGAAEATIISAIQTATPNFDIRREALSALVSQKVPDRVILSMVRRQNSVQPAPQTQVRPNSKSSDAPEPKWEVELHGGIFKNYASGGWAAPPAAESYSLSGSGAKGYTSSRVSSWYFGDGVELIGLTSSLDSILQKPLAKLEGQTFGFRVSRAFSKRLAVEFTLDRGSRLVIPNDTLTQIEAVRSGFKDFWERLDVPGNTPSSSISTIASYGGRQVFSTGAVVLNLSKSRRVRPYVTAGAGVIFSGSSTAGLTFVGSYGGPNALETDTVRLTFAQSSDRMFAPVLGGGVKVFLTKHVGVRLDLRAYLPNNDSMNLLNAIHTNTPGAAWVVKASGDTSAPVLQLLTGPGLEAYSTLSGPAISGLKTYFGNGVQRQIPVTVGFFYRF
jgi:hypothetical protein